MSHSTKQTSATELEAILNDPFYSPDINLDMSGLSPDTRAKLRPAKQNSDDWDTLLVAEVISNSRADYQRMLEDPEIRKELAIRDPEFAKKWVEEECERIVAEFRQANPDYLKTERNADRIIGALAKRYLGKDWLDTEDAISKLFEAGHWTVPELTSEYKRAVAAGELDTPIGTIKALSRREQLDVIATLREGSPDDAVMAYLTYALGGKLPRKYRKASDFLVDYPDLATEAVWFIWRNSQSNLDANTLAAFQAHVGNVQLPTVALLQNAWFEFLQSSERKYPALFARTSETSEPQAQNPEELSDAALDAAILRAKREARAARGY